MPPSGQPPFEIGFGSRATSGRQREPDAPFRLLVCADLSGDAPAARAVALADRKPLRVDIDSLERVFKRLAPRVTLSIPGAENPIEFEQPQDFHPDSLVRRIPLFGALRSLRADLADPARFEKAATTLGAGTPDPTAAAAVVPPAAPATGDASADIERLLGRKPSATPAAAATSVVKNLIKDIVAPHIVPDTSARQRSLIASVDAALAQLLRKVLRDPGFQRLEATWRAVERLVSEVGGEENVQLFLLDVTKDELLADVRSNAKALGESAIARALLGRRTESADGAAWSVIALGALFSASGADVALLASLGSLAGAGGAALLAGVDGSPLGCADGSALGKPQAWQTPDAQDQANWRALRSLPAAAAVAVAGGRVLMRRPYGAKSDPIDAFTFEEITDPQDAASYLWGSAAPLLGLLAAQAFLEDGWDMRLDSRLEIADLPAFSYRDADGEVQMRACAESLIPENVAARWVEAGIMPLMGRRDRHSVQLIRWQSLAEPAQALQGPWA